MARVDVELAHRVGGLVVLSLAGGGWKPDRKYADKAFQKKLDSGRDKWGAMTESQRSRRTNSRIIPCECLERKGKRWVAWKGCIMCGGKGKRTLNAKERTHLEWCLSNWEKNQEKETAGKDCCVDYVIDSTVFQMEHGSFNAPLETDGYTLLNYYVKPRPEMEEVEFPVKICDNIGNVIGVKVKRVMVIKRVDRCMDGWKLLRAMLSAKKEEIELVVASTEDPAVLKLTRRSLWQIKKVQSALLNRGSAKGNMGDVRDVLARDGFSKVEHLWRTG